MSRLIDLGTVSLDTKADLIGCVVVELDGSPFPRIDYECPTATFDCFETSVIEGVVACSPK